MKVSFMYYFLECFTMSIFGIWKPENAISAHTSTCLFKSKILHILVLGLEIYANIPI